MIEITFNGKNITVDPLNDRVISIFFTKNRKNPNSIWLLHLRKENGKTFFYYHILHENGSETFEIAHLFK